MDGHALRQLGAIALGPEDSWCDAEAALKAAIEMRHVRHAAVFTDVTDRLGAPAQSRCCAIKPLVVQEVGQAAAGEAAHFARGVFGGASTGGDEGRDAGRQCLAGHERGDGGVEPEWEVALGLFVMAEHAHQIGEQSQQATLGVVRRLHLLQPVLQSSEVLARQSGVTTGRPTPWPLRAKISRQTSRRRHRKGEIDDHPTLTAATLTAVPVLGFQKGNVAGRHAGHRAVEFMPVGAGLDPKAFAVHMAVPRKSVAGGMTVANQRKRALSADRFARPRSGAIFLHDIILGHNHLDSDEIKDRACVAYHRPQSRRCLSRPVAAILMAISLDRSRFVGE